MTVLTAKRALKIVAKAHVGGGTKWARQDAMLRGFRRHRVGPTLPLIAAIIIHQAFRLGRPGQVTAQMLLTPVQALPQHCVAGWVLAHPCGEVYLPFLHRRFARCPAKAARVLGLYARVLMPPPAAVPGGFRKPSEVAKKRVTEFAITLQQEHLAAVARREAQIVSFNGANADVPAMVQRALLTDGSCPAFCERPAKPWEGLDYFAGASDAHVDLARVLAAGGYGKAVTPSLAEAAAVAGIPGKVGNCGADVVDMWLRRDHQAIIDYNQLDCVVTYLLWLKAAHFAGHMCRAEFEAETISFLSWLDSLARTHAHIAEYLVEWLTLRSASGADAA